jgi:hypothetical protein
MQQLDRHRRKRAEKGPDCSLRFAWTCVASTPSALIQRFVLQQSQSYTAALVQMLRSEVEVHHD